MVKVRIEEMDWWAPDLTFEPDELECILCGTTVGPVTTGDDDRVRWSGYVQVQVQADKKGPGDTEPTHFCVDCYGWLEEIAPAITERVAATTRRQEEIRASLARPNG